MEPEPERPRVLPLDPDIDADDDVGRWSYGSRGRSALGARLPLRPHASTIAAVALGGFAGGISRYAVGLAWPERPGAFPYGALLVNTVGAFALGLAVVVLSRRRTGSPYLRPLIGTGFCGGFTTFSSAVVSTDRLWSAGHSGVAIGYVVASLVAGLAAAWLGMRSGLLLDTVRRA